ncbi:tail fiber domain-containing protein [Methylobacterium sp. sgz302541]|uniref:tail fiber domain-containing protein n=1 Tax=unclassified Methylobacterium TaxID=2615210 RepID=UPI003D33A134
MSGGSRTQTTQQSSQTDPWKPAQPALQNILDGATTAYQSGVGSQVYGGQRVAGLGDTTQAGLGEMADGASAGAPTAASGNDFLHGLLAGGGTTAATQAATGGLAGIDPNADTSGVASAAARMADPNGMAATVGNRLASGGYNLDASGYRGLLGENAGPTQTQRSLQATADGAYLNGSPQLDAITQRASDAAASRVAQSMAASGRYGSGRFAAATADAVAGQNDQLRYADLNNQLDRQAQAASAIDSARNAQTGIRSGLLGNINDVTSANAGQAVTGAGLTSGADAAALTGASALAGLQGSNADRALGQAGALLSSAQGDRAAGLAGIAATPTVQQSLAQPGQTLAQVGTIQDQARQQQLDSNREIFDEGQSAPWRQIGLYEGAVNPIAGLGSQTSGTSTQRTQTDPGLLNSIIGGISGLSGAAANVGRAAPFLAMLSDERAKEDVQEVGKLHDGQTVYSYRYKGNPTPQIGLLAQEVAGAEPDAVALFPGGNGLLGVDYGRATARAAAMAPQDRRAA